MRNNQFFHVGRVPHSVPEYRPDVLGERCDPDIIHRPDKYDHDFIWDGETMDEEKT